MSSQLSKAVSNAIARGYQISPDALKLLQTFAQKQTQGPALESIIAVVIEAKVRELIGKNVKGEATINEADLVAAYPELFENPSALTSVSNLPEKSATKISDNIDASLEIVNDPSDKIQPVGIEGFSQLFKSRYEKIMRIFKERPEARQLTKIRNIDRDKGGRVTGLVYSKKTNKNGGVELVLDDETAKITVFAGSEDARRVAGEVFLDECVMIDVEGKGGRFFLKNIIRPDIPNKVVAPSKKVAYTLFLSDLHVGSNKFLEAAFSRLIEWLSGLGPQAEEDEEIIRRMKYVVIGGDIVDGVGIFPTQEAELTERNIFKQYELVSSKLALIPERLKVLAIPGNHDSTRQALPQPMIPHKYAASLYDLKNLTMLGDPSLVKLNGVSVLIFHGRSLDDVLATTPGLSYERPTEAMKLLLRARHLAPIFGSRTPIAPELEDHLVIDQVPDIFHAGHVHSVGVENYRGTLIINSGTWQAQTGYQANLGIRPSPGIAPIVNLATLEVMTREFLTTRERPVMKKQDA